MYPEALTGKVRVYMPSLCKMTHPLHWLTGAGDSFWVTSKAYSHALCIKQHAWLDAFYTALRGRLDPTEWYVLDVGGSMGKEPIVAAKHGYHAYTFEPFLSNIVTLKFNAAINCVHELVTPTTKGTARAQGGSCRFNKDAAHSGMSFAGTQVSVDRTPHAKSTEQRIGLTSMDDELRETFDARKRPLLWKIDNQGSELATLEGAKTLLST